MRCPACGRQNPEDAAYCVGCGDRLGDGATAEGGVVGKGWVPPGAFANDNSGDAAPPVDPAEDDVFVGVVRGFTQRSEWAPSGNGHREVWSFRVERYDGAGNRLQPVPVEMRGHKFDGSLTDGDTVRIEGRWKAGKTLRVKCVHDLTTGATIEAKGLVVVTVLSVLFVIVFMAVTIVVLVHLP